MASGAQRRIKRDILQAREGGVRRPGNRGRLVLAWHGDMRRWQAARGKSELHRAGCWLTASGGDPKESATETYRRARSLRLQPTLARVGKGEMAR